jgi:hypothetical protein
MAVQIPANLLPDRDLGDATVETVNVGTPSVTDFKPRTGWKEIRRWLESLQLIQAALTT